MRIQEIVTHSGSQFDPTVVEAFLRVIGRFPAEAETDSSFPEEQAA